MPETWECDAPCYAIVAACADHGFSRPLDRPWHRQPDGAVVALCHFRWWHMLPASFQVSVQGATSIVTVWLAQCGRCGAIYWR
jgi:hypothetical protein